VFTPLEMSTLNGAAVKSAVERSRVRLGVEAVDLMQFYWADYKYDK
jgi:aryl-alcohol dehydrogenase-like predicted oxidoreductase